MAPRKPPRRGKKTRLHMLPPLSAKQRSRPIKTSTKPTIQRDWSVITHAAVKLFDHHRFVDAGARTRAIRILLKRWERIFPLRVLMQKENEQLSMLDRKVAELEAEHTRILLRCVNTPGDVSVQLQRRANVIQRRTIGARQLVLANRLLERYKIFERRMTPVPEPLKKELYALAKPFWESMVGFLTEYVAE